MWKIRDDNYENSKITRFLMEPLVYKEDVANELGIKFFLDYLSFFRLWNHDLIDHLL